ncbi:MAG: hypothetical protein R2681_14335 [Pyrinomonadaceae bacterium]
MKAKLSENIADESKPARANMDEANAEVADFKTRSQIQYSQAKSFDLD